MVMGEESGSQELGGKAWRPGHDCMCECVYVGCVCMCLCTCGVCSVCSVSVYMCVGCVLWHCAWCVCPALCVNECVHVRCVCVVCVVWVCMAVIANSGTSRGVGKMPLCPLPQPRDTAFSAQPLLITRPFQWTQGQQAQDQGLPQTPKHSIFNFYHYYYYYLHLCFASL